MTTKLPDRIAISGPMRSGKSTLAGELEKLGYTHLSVADAPRYLCVQLASKIGGTLPEEAKLWLINPSAYSREIADYIEANKPVYRPLIQGMAVTLRAVAPDYFINDLIRRLDTAAKAVVPDLRFPNEAAALKKEGFTLVRLIRSRDSILDSMVGAMRQPFRSYESSLSEARSVVYHESETALDDYDGFDIIVDVNDGVPNILSLTSDDSTDPTVDKVG